MIARELQRRTRDQQRHRRSSARRTALAREEPEEVREAFDSIEATGVEALAEMRRLLGMLRKGDEEQSRSEQMERPVGPDGYLDERVAATYDEETA